MCQPLGLGFTEAAASVGSARNDRGAGSAG